MDDSRRDEMETMGRMQAHDIARVRLQLHGEAQAVIFVQTATVTGYAVVPLLEVQPRGLGAEVITVYGG